MLHILKPVISYSNLIGQLRLSNRVPCLTARSQVHHRARSKSVQGGSEFGCFLVLDFEATCDRGVNLEPQEIIEFPVLLVNAKNFRVESKFHRYVRPEFHPTLTTFCTQLTGIVQEMVDNESTLDKVLIEFNDWMVCQDLLNGEKTFAFVTCGDWDLRYMLPHHCQHKGLSVPDYFKSWINIKQVCADLTGVYPRNIPHLLALMKLPQVGRLHSGIDDCRNLAAALAALGRLAKGDYRFRLTSTVEAK